MLPAHNHLAVQVHFLHGGLPGGRDGGAAGELCRPGSRQPVRRAVPGAAQQAQRHLLLPPGDGDHHAAVRPPLPANVPPHVRPEEEGPGHPRAEETGVESCPRGFLLFLSLISSFII
jgi:hypothetical protein